MPVAELSQGAGLPRFITPFGAAGHGLPACSLMYCCQEA